MAENQPVATPPAPSGGTSPDVKTLIAEGVAAAVKPLQEKLDAFETKYGQQATQQTQPGAAVPQKEQPVTRKQLDELLAQRNTSETAAAARKEFVGSKLKDLPAIYQDRLGSDPAKWAEQEQAIRQQFQADFKAQGGTVPPVAGAGVTGRPAAEGAKPDLSKLSPTQKIGMGLTPVPVRRTEPQTPTAA